jgi:predicted nucleotidyltransferase
MKKHNSEAMTNSRVEETIREMVRRISEGFHPEMIVLFGSYARGDAGPDSDVDLLVVMRINGSKRDLTLKIRKALAGMGLAKDIIVVTPEELARYRDLVGTIIYPAMREGRVVYERSA